MIGLALAVVGACRGGPAPPQALVRYLDALVAADYDAAYRLTQFAKGGFGQGAAVSEAHFIAFYRATPLQGYDVTNVQKLEQRAFEAASEKGVPFYIVDVGLDYGTRVSPEQFTVEGQVLPVVTVEPVPLRIQTSGVTTIRVDGVAVDVADADGDGILNLLLLNGPHTLTIGERSIRMVPQPLTVIDGDARVEQRAGKPILVAGP